MPNEEGFVHRTHLPPWGFFACRMIDDAEKANPAYDQKFLEEFLEN
jgi:hypothetical protein